MTFKSYTLDELLEIDLKRRLKDYEREKEQKKQKIITSWVWREIKCKSCEHAFKLSSDELSKILDRKNNAGEVDCPECRALCVNLL